MIRYVIIMLIVICAFGTNGQSLKGIVQGDDGKPLPAVNVLLLSSVDSSLVKGAVSDTTGVYTIDNIRSGRYLVSASMIGYRQAYSSPITIAMQDAELEMAAFTLMEDARQLGEVVVVEKRPFVEQHIDRMIVNVANSIIASGSTALEVLEKSPGITVDRQNGSIQLRGKEGVIVQMNGKQTYLSMAELVTLLQTMTSDDIDRIELITNPSAKYDAAGNSGIINIVMKKNNNEGTNGSVSLGVGSGKYGRQRGSFQLNHRTRKINIFGNYSANHGGNYFHLKGNQSIDNGEQINHTDQETYIRFFDRGQNAKAGLDYFLSKNTTLGFVWTGFWNNNGEEGTASSKFQKDGSDITYLQAQTDKTIGSISANQIGNINLQHSFKGKGGELTADLDFGRYTRDYSNTLLTETITIENPEQPNTGLLIEMPTTIDIRTAKVDYNRAVSPRWKMEAGLKTSYVASDNDMTLSHGETGSLAKVDTLSNHFQYTEQVYAGYASFSGTIGEKTQVQAGLRVEHTHSVGNSLTFDQVVTRDYINFFPSLFISRPLSKNHSLTVSYSYRIDRPNYQFLNPARSYVDPYLYSRGNPFLNPQYTHSLEFKHGFKEKLFTSIGASFVDDVVFYVIQPVDSIRTERTPDNFGTAQSYNLTVSFPIEVLKGWNMQVNVLGVYSQFDYKYLDVPTTVEQISGRLNASNTIVFGHGWTGEVTGWVSTPGVYIIQETPWLGSVDVGIQKSIGSALKAKITLQDVFHSNKYMGKIDAPSYKTDFTLAFDTRVLMLNLIYSFGNQQLRGTRQRRTGSEEEAQRAN
jgi:Outer membrane protein beta-barrel family/Carboxypeptidase regulatory-like domain